MVRIRFFKLKIFSLYCLLFAGLNMFSLLAQVGNAFPSWAEGYMDIHHINTGKGESAFFILPDGTTMLVDAGASDRKRPPRPDPLPDSSRTPGEWISRYIFHMLEGHKEKKLDYILLTHYHSDHMGDLNYPGVKTSNSRAYELTGITEVGENVPFDKIIDRGWDYLTPTAELFENYIGFVNWQVANNGVKAEQFLPGHNDQIILVKNPDGYPGFEFRNIAANGIIWTGFGNNVRSHFPSLESLSPSEYPSENMNSIVFRLAYGKFNYFNGGDIFAGTPGHWRDMETPVGLVTGPVDVCIANHHAYLDAMSTLFLQSTRPRVHIIQSCCPTHPSSNVLRRILSSQTYPGPRDVFSTNIMDATRVVIGPAIDNLKSQQGHIVIRVDPGGDAYKIYILDDTEENFKITAVHGPYKSGT